MEPFAELIHASMEHDVVRVQDAGLALGFMRETDNDRNFNLFSDLCMTAIEAFEPKYNSPSQDGTDPGVSPYQWGQTDLMDRLVSLAKDAAFAFRLRPPPREAIFLDRKMVGVYVFISTLGLRLGPRTLLQKYIEPIVRQKS